MKVILVGNNPASLTYIRNKKRMCEEIGASFSLDQLPESIKDDEFLAHIRKLNQDASVNGIIIQLPVSESLKKLNLPNLINPAKDIDGFHGLNTQALYSGSTDMKLLLPCTPKGIINLLKFYQIPLEGKHIVVIGRSLIVGKPMAMLLSNFDATVTLTHSKTNNLKKLTRSADIVISAIGKPHFLNHDFFTEENKTIVIDVGMNSLDGRLVGDVNFEQVKSKILAISPVPGGVGPMTVISLIENLITATENQLKE